MTVRFTFLDSRSHTIRGIGFLLISTLSMSAMITLVRHLSADLHPFQLAFFRAFFGFVVFIPLFIQQGLAPLRTQRLALHGLRATLHSISVILFFYGLMMTPLAKAISIQFSAPLFASILAIVILGEPLRLGRIAALTVGFAGALVVLRPGIVPIGVETIAILIAAAMWGTALIVIKALARTESSATMTIYSTLLMSPITLIIAIPVWQHPNWIQLFLLLIVGALASAGHLALATAMKHAEVTALTPVEFTKLIWVAAFGFVFFDEIPDWGIWIGGSLIFAATTYMGLRERHAAHQHNNPKS
ncbi:MAG TPA: DMT family transporter [Gammaproteobacteria bacterium]|nr:DMT family transporter [Gammaproteobacteria bacterium]HIL17715.1 DMT family transporter [Gammaproteobacteria bacterium]